MANNDWGTPPQYIESARAAMGSIDCDPASNDRAQAIVQAGVYYTKERSSLYVNWEGNVWLNPPYGRGLPQVFVDRLVNMYELGFIEQAVILTNTVYTSNWWKETGIAKHVNAVCLPDHRIAFINPDTGQPERGNDRDQVFTYIGPNSHVFARAFRDHGACYLSGNFL